MKYNQDPGDCDGDISFWKATSMPFLLDIGDYYY